MADIQQVRYDLPTQPAPGFMDYAAQFVTGLVGAKKEKSDYEKELFKSMASSLASTKQLESAAPGQGMQIGGQEVPWRMRQGGMFGSGVPVKVGGQDYTVPVDSLEDLNRISAINKREKPPELNPSTALTALMLSKDWQTMFTNDKEAAIRQIVEAQEEYRRQSQGGGVTSQRSPYPDYPDAYPGTDGVWRVKRNGKTYKIEE